MNKEQVIAIIKQRILDEQRKHKTLDWAEIAARKIYSTHLVKEICNLPVVSNRTCPKCKGEMLPQDDKICIDCWRKYVNV